VLVKPAWLLTENYLQDQMGHEEFGMYAAIFALGYTFFPLADLGINQFTTRLVAQTKTFHARVFEMVWNTKSVLSLLYSILFLVFGFFLGYPMETVALVTGYFVFLSFSMLFRGYFQADQRFLTDGLASVLDRLFLMGAIWLFLPSTAFRYAIITLVTGIMAFVTVGLIFWLRYRVRIVFHFRFFKGIVRRAFPFAVMALFAAVNERIEPVFVEQIGGAYETGLYVGAYRWISAVSMYIWTILPYFYARFSHIPRAHIQQHANLLNTGILIVGLPILGFWGLTYTMGEKFFFLFQNSSEQEIHYMKKVLVVLAIGLTLNAFFNVFSTYLTATGYEKRVNLLLFFSVIFHVIVSCGSIFMWKGLGGAIAYSATLFFTSVGYVYLVERHTPLPVPWKLLFKIFILAFLFVLFTLWIGQWELRWYMKGLIQLTLLGMLGLLFCKKEVFQAWRTEE